MKTATPWLYGFAVAVALSIVSSLFKSPASRTLAVPLMLASFVIGFALFSKLGFWPALGLWWGLGIVIGSILEFRDARHRRDSEVKRSTLVTVVYGLFIWPIKVPLMLLVALVGGVVIGVLNLYCIFYKKLLPNHVPHYRGIEGCREAAVCGDARAQFTLGCGYESGEYGLPQDDLESAKWFRKAAEQNHYGAQLRLGICLTEGKGVDKNVSEGLMWILLSNFVSAEHGAGYFFRDAAHQASARAQAEMTEQQIAQARVMLDSLPLYKVFKERFEKLFSAFEPTTEKLPTSQKVGEV